MDSTSDIIFKPARSTCVLLLLFTFPAECLLAFMGIEALTTYRVAGAMFIIASVALAFWTIFVTTTRICLGDQALIRNWAWGSSAVPIKEITRLEWGGSRGQRFLTIRTKKRFMMLGSPPLSRDDLDVIQQKILASLGLQNSPRLPRYANYLDIAEMAKQRVP